MNKNLIVFGIIVLLLIVGLSGCIDGDDGNDGDDGANRPEEFVGTWTQARVPTTQITFFQDGECSYLFGSAGTWEVKDEKLVLELNQGSTLVCNYVFSNNNQHLSLTSQGRIEDYIKQ